MPVKSKDKTGQEPIQSHDPEPANLDRRYGKIGIPAVAAALRYYTVHRQPRSPAADRIEERFIELAA
jgi:hypothetical protein